MIDAERLLRGLMNGGMAKKGGGMLLLGGLAMAAFEHFSEQRRPPSGSQQPPPQPPPQQPKPQQPQSHQTGPNAGNPPPPPLPRAQSQSTPPVPPPPGAPLGHEKALLLIRAMIAAAKADGEIDANERGAILDHIDEQRVGRETRAFLEAEIARPVDLDTIASAVGDAVTAAEVYAVSLMAIEVDTEAERAHLDSLAARLGLQPEQVKAIEERYARA